MLTNAKCEGCEFFKKHILLKEKDVELVGATCLICNKSTSKVINNFLIDELYNECPLIKIKKHDKVKKMWSDLKNYMVELYQKNQKINNEYCRVLKDIMYKVKEIEKGESLNDKEV